MGWQYRNEVIFGLSLIFALKSIVLPDIASVAGLILFLGAHYLDRFFSAERAEAKVISRMQAVEDELKVVKEGISRVSLSIGIRGSNK